MEAGMTKVLRSIVIATEDPVVINQLSTILLRYDYSVIIEKSTIKSILKILEQEIKFLILDIDSPQNSNMDLIDIIKRTRPRLPIVVISEDNSLVTIRKLAEAGVFYCALKPLQIGEMEKVFEALERLHQKNGQLENLICEKIKQIEIKNRNY